MEGVENGGDVFTGPGVSEEVSSRVLEFSFEVYGGNER